MNYKKALRAPPEKYNITNNNNQTTIDILDNLTFEINVVKFVIIGSDIYIEFSDNEIIQLERVSISTRIKAIRERILMLRFKNNDNILATMPSF
jgi:hypothetical protein